MTDNFKGIVSTIRDTNRTIYSASDLTQRHPRIVRTAPMNMRNGQRTDTSGASLSVQRTSTPLPISPTLFKQVTPAVEAEGPASCLNTQPDTANTYIDADAANVTGHKMDANASVISAPSSTSSSQDNTRNHASQVNVSSESAGQIITRRRRRVNRTVRRISEDQEEGLPNPYLE
ncbi:hypothetical protein GE21DRAFT_9809 [Neurospora crassa]|uniref:Uncharacterized protein n=1 Tax=Neurospora crassa (strain ATCC 24698 / 74-OR23-1A / CBS 708.71 / DSM 1257 / FGSC 987) TaxID=367110 RepID=Q7S3E9_NEUCR|nr:hypothetical protein NCU06904 [Neurospora crassa OR74A]EAA30015.1 hypothetical protein NCU06904 [Neurospora crassa OR74A]KHE82581.1 hypothetical protein GE21DRAFT_9809 [Neurospora crassa]|eukprot:XP_959251.1 hypothetical protein NCU06904 [Neurospora crassa OR74A]